MVHKYPSTKDDLKRRREHVSLAEIKFYEITDALNDNWHVWHSINWDKKASKHSGEADYLLFNPKYGFMVIEVKGGVISVENNTFYSRNQKTGENHRLDKSPFNQAQNSMYYIKDFYEKRASKQENPRDLLKHGKFFPLSFSYGVFFSDTKFKRKFQYIQYPNRRIFDETDYITQKEWMEQDKKGPSPLETFIVESLDEYKHSRMLLPGVKGFFIEMIGSNISRFINLKKYYDFREEELDQVNRVQDFLLHALSRKRKCIFRGSAGSGKTFIAMKKALLCHEHGLKTIMLCFNSELREYIRNEVSKRLGKPYDELENLKVNSIHSLLITLLYKMFRGTERKKLLEELNQFQYSGIAKKLIQNANRIPSKYKYDALIIDEAQDIDSNLWRVAPKLLKNQKKSILYVFYDSAQSIFVDEFTPKHFNMNEHEDLIVLSHNLRNTIEIAKFLEKRTSYKEFKVKYEQYSGIQGFKISRGRYKDPLKAFKTAVNHINKELFKKEIEPEQLIILGYNKLQTIIRKCKENDLCFYVGLQDKTEHSNKRIFIVEPKLMGNLPEIEKKLESKWIVPYKTISGFKGLERDIVFLIVPNLNTFKKKSPDKFLNFKQQVYVGASRAKFKLYFFEYDF